ncbi:MAG TPA: hypothetical protein ENK26_14425 [Gammaproteobacteria bacterium]|nr:hypothetical protein [Gammaproteobacteria bacterium]
MRRLHRFFSATTGWPPHVRLEVFIAEARAEEVAEDIVDSAHSGLPGDGLVAILPVASVYHIRTWRRCDQDAC